MGPLTVAQTLYPYFKAARKGIAARDAAWEEDARAAARQGFRPHYCKHGTDLWVDYDPICGWCEEELTPLQEAVAVAWARFTNHQIEHAWNTTLAFIKNRNGEL